MAISVERIAFSIKLVGKIGNPNIQMNPDPYTIHRNQFQVHCSFKHTKKI
jgi:hypothetical protein